MVPGPIPARHHPDAATTKRRLTTSRRCSRVRITAHTRATRAYLSPSSAAPTTASHPLSFTPIYRPSRPSLLRPLLRHSTFRSTLPSAFRSTWWPSLGRNLGHHVPHTIRTYPRRRRITERAGCCRAQARYDAQRYSLLSANVDTALYRCSTRICQLVRKPGIKHRRGANRTPCSKRRAKPGFVVDRRRFLFWMEISAGSTRFELRAEKGKRGTLHTKESDVRENVNERICSPGNEHGDFLRKFTILMRGVA